MMAVVCAPGAAKNVVYKMANAVCETEQFLGDFESNVVQTIAARGIKTRAFLEPSVW